MLPTLILNAAIAFLIRIDFVEPLPEYFPVMIPALILIFAVAPYPILSSTADCAQTFAGCWQALTIRVSGFPTTLLFFRNSLLSDLFLTTLFVITQMIFNQSRPGIAEAAPPVA
jgi:hypothetical protein